MVEIVLLLAGLLSRLSVGLGGDLYLVNFLLLACLPVVLGPLRRSLRHKVAGHFLLFGILFIMGYAISDLYRETAAEYSIKGIGKAVLLLLDWLALSALLDGKPKRIGLLLCAVALGSLLYNIPYPPRFYTDEWKLFSGDALGILIALSYSFLPLPLVLLGLVGHGLLSFALDSRITGFLPLLTVALTVMVRTGFFSGRSRLAHVRMTFFGGVALLAVGMVYTYTLDKDTAMRRQASNVGRLAGVVTAIKGVAMSPIVGYGSWPKDPELIALYREETRETRMRNLMVAQEGMIKTYNPHSKFFQAWIEGGILSMLLMGYLVYRLLRMLYHVVVVRPLDRLTPALLLSGLGALWAAVQSPFAAYTVMVTAMHMAIVTTLDRVEREAEQEAAASTLAGAQQAPSGQPGRPRLLKQASR